MEQLKSAFRGTDGLTALDAITQGKHAYGMLAKGFEFQLATALRDSLAMQGVEAEVVEEASLPQLPEMHCLSRLDCTAEALLVHDSLGRVATVEWKEILVIAAGSVLVTEFKEVRTPLEPSVERGAKMLYSPRRRIGLGLEPGSLELLFELAKEYVPPPAELEKSRREEQQTKLWLEIILVGAATRYRINADLSAVALFQYLGERRTKELPRNFSLLVQDVMRGAPQAALNHGAYTIRENADELVSYPSKTVFYNELVRLLWLIGPNQARGE